MKIVATITAWLLGITGVQAAPNQPVEAVSKPDKEHRVAHIPTLREVRSKALNSFENADDFEGKKLVVQQFAKWYATKRLGYTKRQWRKVNWIWSKESAWRWDSEFDGNAPTAKGIPQIKWSKWGDWNDSPFEQVALGFKYIEERYDSPDAAYAHKRKHGWY